MTDWRYAVLLVIKSDTLRIAAANLETVDITEELRDIRVWDKAPIYDNGGVEYKVLYNLFGEGETSKIPTLLAKCCPDAAYYQNAMGYDSDDNLLGGVFIVRSPLVDNGSPIDVLASFGFTRILGPEV